MHCKELVTSTSTFHCFNIRGSNSTKKGFSGGMQLLVESQGGCLDEEGNLSVFSLEEEGFGFLVATAQYKILKMATVLAQG